MNLLSIIGTRPQIIKCSSIEDEILNFKKKINHDILHTGQHFDTSMSKNIFTKILSKKPIKNLNVSSKNGEDMTGLMITKIEKFLSKKNYDYILLYGDTNSTLAGSIASKRLNFKIAHIEAGIRSYNMSMPEEVNRLLTDNVSDFLFCPTQSSMKNLKKENITKNVYNFGDVMYDTYLKWEKNFSLPSKKEKSIFVTIHRPYNTDNKSRLKKILSIFKFLSKKNKINFSLHPRTKKKMDKFNLSLKNSNINMMKPLNYFETLQMIRNSKCVITDSGGLQKESYFLKIPCITIRSESEWFETIDLKYNKLIFNNLNSIKEIANKNFVWRKKKYKSNLFGKGQAAKQILKTLYKNL